MSFIWCQVFYYIIFCIFFFDLQILLFAWIFMIMSFYLINKEVTNMTILNCSATKCIYNDNKLWSRGDIEITGDNAHRADETSCGSFRDRTTAAMQNSGAEHCGCEKINIDCKAQECTYNNKCNCTASSINVAGCSTDGCNETKCSTFACKCWRSNTLM